MKVSWDDIRLARVIAETGTLTRAAHKLDVAHTTVARRLEVLEKACGAGLFERVGQRLLPTQAGHALIALADRFDAGLEDLARAWADEAGQLDGVVTVTAGDLPALHLARNMDTFRERYPAIHLRVRVGGELLDLRRREADVAIRVNPEDAEGLVGKLLFEEQFAVYGTRACLERGDAPWITLDETMPQNPQSTWERSHVEPSRVVLRTNSRATLWEAARRGVGLAVLPASLAERDDKLVRSGGFLGELRMPVWVLTHKSVKLVPRVRAVVDFIVEIFRRPSKKTDR
jgi:DNA-binding transcriptional LysR family regulator